MKLGMTVDDIGRRMSSTELSEWMAFDTLEPIGSDWRADARHAYLCAMLCSLHGVKDAEARSPRNHMPDWDGSLSAPQPEKLLDVAKALAASGMGTITTGG